MPWLKLELETDCNDVANVVQALEECGALAVTISDARDQALFEDDVDATALWAHNRVSGLFPAGADIAALVQQLEQSTQTALAYRVEPLAERDWQSACTDSHGPLHFGANLWVCPTWSKPPAADTVNVFIDPGLAFGSGAHPSTQLCLTWLAEHGCERRQVIDYGCGSGILAIAALKLGAARAWGVDHDLRALQVSEANAAYNGVAERYRALTPASLPHALVADIVFANILAKPLIELAPALINRMKPGAALILSGLLEEQAGQVLAHYAKECTLTLHVRDDPAQGRRWAMLAGRRGK
ncbi:MAG: 50S ribosomal protein L11 methyltransferase [Acidiferrobacterales bacterium]